MTVRIECSSWSVRRANRHGRSPVTAAFANASIGRLIRFTRARASASKGELTGIAVNVEARIAPAPGAGEVVVSSTVRDVVAGSGLTLVDRGLGALKGVEEPWRLFAVAR